MIPLEASKCEKRVLTPFLGPISAMEPFLTAESRHERCNAALVLAGMGDRRGTALIIRELSDQTPRTTTHLRKDGKPYPERQIIEDRYYAACLLGRLKERDAVPALIAATKDKEIYYQAAISLGQIGDRNAVPALQAMIEEFPEQRLWAGYGLAGLGEPAGFDILTKTIAGSNWVDRRHAVEAIGTLGAHQLKPLLLTSLKDERVQVRISAAVSLGQLGDSGDLPALAEAMKIAEMNITSATDFTDKDDLTRETQFTTVAAKTIKIIESKTK